MKGFDMKRLLTLFTIVSAFTFIIACDCGNETKAQSNTKAAVSTEFTWYLDWDEGMAAAKKEKKPVVVDFYADWCGYCKKMDKETFAAPEIKHRFVNGWIAIKIDIEDKNKTATVDGNTMTHAELVRYFRVTGFPTYLFIDKEGKPVSPYSGYVPKERFGQLLDYFKDEVYTKNIKFNEYIKNNI